MSGPCATMRISDEGLRAIADEEGLARVGGDGMIHRYICPSGKPTIGYGHLIGPDEHDLDAITPEHALSLLRDDVRTAEGYVQRLVTVPLAQDQFDALVSFVFNVGGNAFGRSRLLRLLNAGDLSGAAGEFKFWRLGGGKVLPVLVARRKREEARFRRGIEPPKA